MELSCCLSSSPAVAGCPSVVDRLVRVILVVVCAVWYCMVGEV